MGRPPFKPTEEQKLQVSIAAGSGQMTHEEIAIGLGISKPTLYEYFEAELSTGAYQRRLEVLAALHKTALKGNAAAVKAYLEMDPSASTTPQKQDEKPTPLGKKEQAQVDATVAADNTAWSELLPRHGTAPSTNTRQ